MTSQIQKNKKMGASFEADVRTVFDKNGQFVYVKGVSTKGIDVLALKNDKAVQLELKTYAKWQNYQFNDAMKQLKANESIVKSFLERTFYKPELVQYILVYYVRGLELIISNVDERQKIYEKSRKDNLIDFLQSSLIDYKALDDII